MAKRLGNTRAVCRKCYIHPAILDAYMDGATIRTIEARARAVDRAALGPERARGGRHHRREAEEERVPRSTIIVHAPHRPHPCVPSFSCWPISAKALACSTTRGRSPPVEPTSTWSDTRERRCRKRSSTIRASAVHRFKPSSVRYEQTNGADLRAGRRLRHAACEPQAVVAAAKASRRRIWSCCRIRRHFRPWRSSWFSLHRRNVRFVIDWHNLGYTVLRQRLGRWNPAVRLARWYERRDARRVDANICVSRGMAAWLETKFDVVASNRPLRSACVRVRADRTDRARTVSAGVVRASRRAAGA